MWWVARKGVALVPPKPSHRFPSIAVIVVTTIWRLKFEEVIVECDIVVCERVVVFMPHDEYRSSGPRPIKLCSDH